MLVFLSEGSNGINAATITIHYNNPGFEEGHRDSSGIRVYWTSKKREHDVGTIALADTFVRMNGPVGSGYSEHTFYCQAGCTSGALAGLTEPITIIGETFHMHKTGVRATNNVIRNGKVVHTASVDFFDYEQNGNLNAQQQPYRIEPGDAFESKFYYHTDGTTKFGLSSQDEMAIVSLRYYPVPANPNFLFLCVYGIPIGNCEATYNVRELSSVPELGRTFGETNNGVFVKSSSANPACPTPPSESGASLSKKSLLRTTVAIVSAVALVLSA